MSAAVVAFPKMPKGRRLTPRERARAKAIELAQDEDGDLEVFEHAHGFIVCQPAFLTGPGLFRAVPVQLAIVFVEPTREGTPRVSHATPEQAVLYGMIKPARSDLKP